MNSGIETMNLTSILIEEVGDENTKLRFKKPLKLTPFTEEESHQLIVTQDTNINLHVYAYTREDLITEINEQIIMMWHEYVKADKEELAEDAIRLRQILLETLEEVEKQ